MQDELPPFQPPKSALLIPAKPPAAAAPLQSSQKENESSEEENETVEFKKHEEVEYIQNGIAVAESQIFGVGDSVKFHSVALSSDEAVILGWKLLNKQYENGQFDMKQGCLTCSDGRCRFSCSNLDNAVIKVKVKNIRRKAAVAPAEQTTTAQNSAPLATLDSETVKLSNEAGTVSSNASADGPFADASDGCLGEPSPKNSGHAGGKAKTQAGTSPTSVSSHSNRDLQNSSDDKGRTTKRKRERPSCTFYLEELLSNIDVLCSIIGSSRNICNFCGEQIGTHTRQSSTVNSSASLLVEDFNGVNPIRLITRDELLKWQQDHGHKSGYWISFVKHRFPNVKDPLVKQIAESCRQKAREKK
jgi:hypothetical protein